MLIHPDANVDIDIVPNVTGDKFEPLCSTVSATMNRFHIGKFVVHGVFLCKDFSIISPMQKGNRFPAHCASFPIWKFVDTQGE